MHDTISRAAECPPNTARVVQYYREPCLMCFAGAKWSGAVATKKMSHTLSEGGTPYAVCYISMLVLGTWKGGRKGI